jgi:general secretion pathway protein D
MFSAPLRRIIAGAVAALCLLHNSACTEYEAVPRSTVFEREANRVSDNLARSAPIVPGIKPQSVGPLQTASASQPYIVGQAGGQNLYQGLGTAPLGRELRFEDAEIREVASTILGDILKKPYVIDTTLRGRISLRIARDVSQRGLMDALVQSVDRVGGEIRLSAGTYEIANASQARFDSQKIAQLQAANPSMSVVQLRFARPATVADLLKALYPASQITVDESYNLLLIGGPAPQRVQMVQTAETLDVDGMSNKTVAVFPISQGNAQAVAEDLRKVYQSTPGAQNSPVEFVALARNNSVMAIARQQSALTRVGQLVRAMDQQRAATGRRMFVVQLQHARAPLLATVLRESLGIRDVQPGTVAATVTATAAPQAQVPYGGTIPASLTGAVPASLTGAVPAAPTEGGASVVLELENQPLRITANTDTNSLVIFATPAEYSLLQEAIRRLDAAPLQVLIEATIMDVTLNDQLQFGVQFFLQQLTSTGSIAQTGITASSFATMGATGTGFNFIFGTPGQVQAAVNALRAVTKVTVLSSPQVVTLDNQRAKLEVGSQVPITTQQITSAATNPPSVTNSITYVQTGVILSVTPRVNSTGGVDLDIRQEVTDAPAALNQITPSLTPVLNRRIIETRVSVQSTQTVALGGLITESASDGRSRVPLLGDIPVVGWLFGQTDVRRTKQELLVFLTPTVFTSPEEARTFSLELRRRIDSIWKKEGSARRNP